MKNYFIVIDKRDFKKMDKLHSNEKIWAFSERDNKEFSKIKENDIIFFGKEGLESWQMIMKVSKKKIDKKFKWGSDLRSKNKQLLLYFDEIDIQPKSRPIIPGLSKYRPGIYKINQKILKNVSEEEKKLDETLRGIPKRKYTQASQPIRDRKKVRDLKNYYQHKCQVCLQRIEIGKNKYYSEVHHLRPLDKKEEGEDDHKNMIVVCPTHHKSFDYCSIRISLDGKTVIDRNEKEIGKLYMKKDHKLSDDNIDYQFYRRLK